MISDFKNDNAQQCKCVHQTFHNNTQADGIKYNIVSGAVNLIRFGQ